METSTKYQEHTSIMKGLNLHSDYAKDREAYKEGFEKIYSQAIEEDVKLTNVKEFLTDLTAQELETLQNYSQLTGEINIDELSDEGAYNLLMHYYEKYDFDNDGFTDNGKEKTISLIPQDMDSDLKEALVNAVNNSDEDSTLSLLALTLDIDQVKYDTAKYIEGMSDVEKEYLKENSSFDIDAFVEAQLNEPYEAKTMTYESIMTQLEFMLNLDLGESADTSFKQNMQEFAKVLENEYSSVKDNKTKAIESQLQIQDLVKSYQNTETVADDPLATLLQA